MATSQENPSFQYAHAVFAGGGVRGIAYVGALEIAEQYGYRWASVAGTSAGAIVAALVAAGYTAQELAAIMRTIDYARFAACPDHDLLYAAEVSNLLLCGGLHDGAYIEEFVREKLRVKGVATFADLLVREQAQNSNLFQRYRLTVIASDITRGQLVRLPQDAHRYGLDPNALDVARAVRMSASIPFFFVPVQLTDANGNTSCIVDGGLLSNFPLFLFEHAATLQTNPAPLPTFGFQLMDASPQNTEQGTPCGLALLKALVTTMLSARDKLYSNEATCAHTIVIPTHDITSTHFELTPEQTQQLYLWGREAAVAFFGTRQERGRENGSY